MLALFIVAVDFFIAALFIAARSALGHIDIPRNLFIHRDYIDSSLTKGKDKGTTTILKD